MDQAPSPTNLAESRKAQILKAAIAVFAEKGYQRATVKEIAGQAGVAPGTIYLYFQNKRDLLLAITDRVIVESVDQTLAQTSDLDPEAYIAAVLRNRVQFARRNQPLLQALVTEIWVDKELRDRFFAQVIGPILETSAHHVQERVAEGKLRPCRVEIIVPAIAGALFVLSALRALVPGHVLTNVTDNELVEELARLYFYGLKPRSEEAAE